MPQRDRFLDAATLRRYSRHRTSRWLAAAALEWAIVLSLMWAANTVGHWWAWVIAAFFIGTRQHAFGILAHESVHRLVSPNRRVNDVLGNLFAAYPLTYPVEGYRTAHIKHHRVLDTVEDPERASVDLFPDDWNFPIPRRRAVSILLRDVTGLNQFAVSKLVRYIWDLPGQRVWPHLLRVAAWHGVAVAIALATGHIWTYLLLWIVPLGTVAPMCFRIRTASEHSGIYEGEVRFQRETPDTIGTTRTITGSQIGQFLFAPYRMCYHIEHHLYPSVPVFALRRLHDELMTDPAYRERVHLTSTYRDVFNELTSAGSGPSDGT